MIDYLPRAAEAMRGSRGVGGRRQHRLGRGRAEGLRERAEDAAAPLHGRELRQAAPRALSAVAAREPNRRRTMILLLVLVTLLGVGLAWWLREKGRRTTHPVPAGHRPEIEIPHTQEFELYHNALSLCSMKSRVCLAELGIPYESHHVDLIETGAYENIRPAFLAVNPGGTVPVLVHDGHPVYESHEQIRYAAEHAPPASPEARARRSGAARRDGALDRSLVAHRRSAEPRRRERRQRDSRAHASALRGDDRSHRDLEDPRRPALPLRQAAAADVPRLQGRGTRPLRAARAGGEDPRAEPPPAGTHLDALEKQLARERRAVDPRRDASAWPT